MGRSASGWRFHRSGESWRRRSRARKQAQTSGGWLAGASPPPSVSVYRHPVEGAGTPLLDLDFGPLFLKRSLDLLCFVLRDAFLDRLGRRVDEILGFPVSEGRSLRGGTSGQGVCLA